jgi:L-serine dehydratase
MLFRYFTRASGLSTNGANTVAVRVADVFKIGIGPSSSHTVGPMRAAAQFATSLGGCLASDGRVAVDLYGSLALTGRGHGTDRAVLLGLAGFAPATVDPDAALAIAERVASAGELPLASGVTIAFDLATDIRFHMRESLPHHPNGMRFSAFDASGAVVAEAEYYSIGGGNVEGPGFAPPSDGGAVPFPFDSAAQLLAIAERNQLAMWEVVAANELALDSADVLAATLEGIWTTMEHSAARGLATTGILPGGLNVRRRAPRLFEKFRAQAPGDTLAAMDYVNVVAIAVNEENAAGGRVVTAPTNGAAGLIPAVGHYYRRYVANADDAGIARFLLTAAAIGMLYKRNASISGAEVGCQGEVGVACSMAAGGLVAALCGTNAQAEHAAEIAMEHNLGMTCDPIGGLVQIPCIERNAIGAVKAINAARMAMSEGEFDEHKISLDQVIEVMYRTGLDMQSKYKETSLGGLAVSVVEC